MPGSWLPSTFPPPNFPVSLASSSAQTGWRLPVVASMATTADLAPSESCGLVIGGSAVFAASRPGTYVSASWPGEKPSLRFHSVGSMGFSATFLGIERMLRFSRLPVAVVGSATVK